MQVLFERLSRINFLFFKYKVEISVFNNLLSYRCTEAEKELISKLNCNIKYNSLVLLLLFLLFLFTERQFWPQIKVSCYVQDLMSPNNLCFTGTAKRHGCYLNSLYNMYSCGICSNVISESLQGKAGLFPILSCYIGDFAALSVSFLC